MTQLVHARNFVSAIREVGYRSAAHAIAELVDNSIQAEASRVCIDVQGNEREGWTVEVWDNGKGMSRDVLATCLQFGGTTRFDDRKGLGRFGLGLPVSGLSMARRIDVYSWRGREANACTLDIDELDSRPKIPAPKRNSLKRVQSRKTSTSGTLVRLSKCDRLSDYLSAPYLDQIRFELRRIFRFYIKNGLELLFNEEVLDSYDPLFLDAPFDFATANQYGPNLRYELASRKFHSIIEVRFSLLPIASLRGLAAAEKRRHGIAKGAGISIVRANREIAYGWYFMGSKRRENYDDWWRCEVKFDPVVDDLFRVSHTKQQITPSRQLMRLLGPDIEGIGRALNAIVRREFIKTARRKPRQSVAIAAAADKYLPAVLRRDSTRQSVAVRDLKYNIVVESNLGDNAFYRCSVVDNRLVLAVNGCHPFAPEYQQARNSVTECVASESMLLAAARAELSAASERERWWFRKFRYQWSDILGTFFGTKA